MTYIFIKWTTILLPNVIFSSIFAIKFSLILKRAVFTNFPSSWAHAPRLISRLSFFVISWSATVLAIRPSPDVFQSELISQLISSPGCSVLAIVHMVRAKEHAANHAVHWCNLLNTGAPCRGSRGNRSLPLQEQSASFSY